MKKCVIFCAAGFAGLLEAVGPEDFVIAADGGLAHVQKLGLAPDLILGDFDSLGYAPAGAQVFPVEKDDTDAMLAVKKGLELGFTEFVIYGGLDGKRLDHTLANYQTLQYLADHGARGTLAGADFLARVIQNEVFALPARDEGLVSVFCLGAEAAGVCIRGLQYTLENGVLTPGFPLGVSNHFIGKEAEISVQQGSLLILWQRV